MNLDKETDIDYEKLAPKLDTGPNDEIESS